MLHIGHPQPLVADLSVHTAGFESLVCSHYKYNISEYIQDC